MAIEVDAFKVLQTFVAKYPTQKAAAEALGIKPVYLSDVLRERRAVSPNILAKLGLKRTVVVVK